MPYRVLIPKEIFDNSTNEQDLLVHVLDYMQRYPHYDFIRLENKFAICERNQKDWREK
ncbi:hypothetical protein [Oceanobacillus limi]|uniref:hypothetical protein n=1 Tax=Oceanobacillus limi TaxID=930131 RepID=UPI0014800CE9|nr:hypothetical protein [Oceanobacillus limi]